MSNLKVFSILKSLIKIIRKLPFSGISKIKGDDIIIFNTNQFWVRTKRKYKPGSVAQGIGSLKDFLNL